MLDGKQSHELEIDAITPAHLGIEQSLPAAIRPWAKAVDMASDGTQSVAESQGQGPFRPFTHPSGRPTLVLGEIGGQGSAIGATGIGCQRPGKGLVEVCMGLHQAGQHQLRGGPISDVEGCHRRQCALLPAEIHGHKTTACIRHLRGR